MKRINMFAEFSTEELEAVAEAFDALEREGPLVAEHKEPYYTLVHALMNELVCRMRGFRR